MNPQSDLYKKSTYINHTIQYLFNYGIFEYDLKDAGFNIIRELELLSKSKIKDLESMSKEERKVAIGKLQLKDTVLKENLKLGFEEARRRFFAYYAIRDDEVISIKKDAIFLTRELGPNNNVGEYLNFREKHAYSSYIRFSKRVEVYYNPITIDIKGINHDNLKAHENYMVDFIKSTIAVIETKSKEEVLSKLSRFADKYKSFQLPVGYYREFNERSMYFDGENYFSEDYEIMKSDHINIEYNYFNIIIPFIKILL